MPENKNIKPTEERKPQIEKKIEKTEKPVKKTRPKVCVF